MVFAFLWNSFIGISSSFASLKAPILFWSARSFSLIKSSPNSLERFFASVVLPVPGVPVIAIFILYYCRKELKIVCDLDLKYLGLLVPRGKQGVIVLLCGHCKRFFCSFKIFLKCCAVI